MKEKRKLHKLLQCLITESKILYWWHKDAAIKQFTQQWCDNYQNDPKAMIDSLLNWHKRIIKLDRLIIKDQDDQKSLITDSSQIKDACNHHFQNVAGSSYSHKENSFEWSLWVNKYQLKDDINSDIYQSLMDP